MEGRRQVTKPKQLGYLGDRHRGVDQERTVIAFFHVRLGLDIQIGRSPAIASNKSVRVTIPCTAHGRVETGQIPPGSGRCRADRQGARPACPGREVNGSGMMHAAPRAHRGVSKTSEDANPLLHINTHYGADVSVVSEEAIRACWSTAGLIDFAQRA